MTVPAPLVSVNLVTYNHEKYIEAAIRSVLDQTFSNLEVVVVNDGSTDGTRQRIDAVTDPAAGSDPPAESGPCRGDQPRARRLSRQIRRLDVRRRSLSPRAHSPARWKPMAGEAPRVLFSAVDFIDDDGQPLPGDHFAAGSFFLENLGRPGILERLFRIGNYFNSITTFAAKEVLLDGGGYDPSLLQMQDFDLWVRLVKKYDLEILADPLVRYRIRSGNENLSSPEPAKQIASLNEHHLVMRRFFAGLPLDLFHAAFGSRLQFAACNTEAELAFEQAQLYLKSPHALNRLIALEKLSELLAEPASAAEVQARYGFGPPQFFPLLRGVNVLNLFAGHESSLFLDTGNGWNAREQLVTRTNLGLASSPSPLPCRMVAWCGPCAGTRWKAGPAVFVWKRSPITISPEWNMASPRRSCARTERRFPMGPSRSRRWTPCSSCRYQDRLAREHSRKMGAR